MGSASVVGVLASPVGVAQAAFPGENGVIALSASDEVMSVHEDGSGLRRLGGGFGPAWSPSGRRIALSAPWPPTSESAEPVLATVDSEGRRLRYIGRHLAGPQYSPAFTPDGKAIVFAFDEGLYRVPTRGRPGPRRLREFNFDLGEIAISSSGRIAFSRATDYDPFCVGAFGYELFVARSDGTRVQRLTDGAEVGGLDWSPDGRRLVFSSSSPPRRAAGAPRFGSGTCRSPADVRPAGGGGVFILNVRSGRLRRIAADGSDPVFSPSGRRIAFVRLLPGSGSTFYVYVMDTDGSGRKAVAEGSQPAWQPLP